MSKPKWGPEQDKQSAAQGWAIFNTCGARGHAPYELQNIDGPEDGSEPIFEFDRQAHLFVAKAAAAGDPLAVAALEFLKEFSPTEHRILVNACHRGWD